VSHQYGGHEAEFDEEYEDEEFEDEERTPRFWVRALVCVVLAATGSGAAFAWHGYGGGELITGALTAAPKVAPASQAIAAQDALLKNLADAQQRAAVIAQGNQDLPAGAGRRDQAPVGYGRAALDAARGRHERAQRAGRRSAARAEEAGAEGRAA
jgi:hypothetical protein